MAQYFHTKWLVDDRDLDFSAASFWCWSVLKVAGKYSSKQQSIRSIIPMLMGHAESRIFWRVDLQHDIGMQTYLNNLWDCHTLYVTIVSVTAKPKLTQKEWDWSELVITSRLVSGLGQLLMCLDHKVYTLKKLELDLESASWRNWFQTLWNQPLN